MASVVAKAYTAFAGKGLHRLGIKRAYWYTWATSYQKGRPLGSSSRRPAALRGRGGVKPAGARRLHQDGPEVRGLQQDRRRLLRLAAGGGRLPAHPAAGFAAETEAHPACCARREAWPRGVRPREPSVSGRTASGARRRAARAPRALPRPPKDGTRRIRGGSSFPSCLRPARSHPPASRPGRTGTRREHAAPRARPRGSRISGAGWPSVRSRRPSPRDRSAGRAPGARPITTSTLSGAGRQRALAGAGPRGSPGARATSE